MFAFCSNQLVILKQGLAVLRAKELQLLKLLGKCNCWKQNLGSWEGGNREAQQETDFVCKSHSDTWFFVS